MGINDNYPIWDGQGTHDMWSAEFETEATGIKCCSCRREVFTTVNVQKFRCPGCRSLTIVAKARNRQPPTAGMRGKFNGVEVVPFHLLAMRAQYYGERPIKPQVEERVNRLYKRPQWHGEI